MTRLFMMIAMAAMLLAACGHRASKATMAADAATDSIAATDSPFRTDSIGLEREDSMVCVKVSIDWPSGTNEALVASIRQYISEELSTSIIQEGQAEVRHFDDGKTAVETTAARRYAELTDAWKEAQRDGFAGDMQYASYMRIFLTGQTDRYVTYLSNAEGFLGGAHGFATSTGITFRKSDGRRIGYKTTYNNDTETFEQSEQTLFSDPASPRLAALIKEGVRSYFQAFDEGTVTDEELRSELTVDDIQRIPLPSNPPLFTPRGLCFTYQQYEIAPYAAGMINFDIPYDKVYPFLTDEAQTLIPRK